MLFSSLLTVTVLALGTHVQAHSVITPALGVAGAPKRQDAKRPSANNPCGGVDVAKNIGTSTTAKVAADGTFKLVGVSLNGGADGGTQIKEMRIDTTGTGKNFKTVDVKQGIVKQGNPNPGNGQSNADIVAKLPAGTTCTGGKCVVGFTTNGNFGNCVIAEQAGGAAAPAAGAANPAAAAGGAAAVAAAAGGAAAAKKTGIAGAVQKVGKKVKKIRKKVKAAKDNVKNAVKDAVVGAKKVGDDLKGKKDAAANPAAAPAGAATPATGAQPGAGAGTAAVVAGAGAAGAVTLAAAAPADASKNVNPATPANANGTTPVDPAAAGAATPANPANGAVVVAAAATPATPTDGTTGGTANPADGLVTVVSSTGSAGNAAGAPADPGAAQPKRKRDTRAVLTRAAAAARREFMEMGQLV